MTEIKHSDNVCVKRSRYNDLRSTGNDYLAISFAPTDEDYRPYEVALYRYCVPGRIDIYHFDWTKRSNCGGRLSFSTEIRDNGGVTLPKALTLLAADLDKPQVVEILVDAVTPEKHMHYSRQLIDNLLAALAPRSKSYRACKRAYDAMFAARVARFEAQRVAEQARATTLPTTP